MHGLALFGWMLMQTTCINYYVHVLWDVGN